MKKKIVFLITILVALCVGLLAGCNYDPLNDRHNPIVETDYFIVQLRHRALPGTATCNLYNIAIILDLTELGKQQEILKIPEYVEGLPVRMVGFHVDTIVSGLSFGINSNNLRKIYIPYSVFYVPTWVSSTYENLEIIFLGAELLDRANEILQGRIVSISNRKQISAEFCSPNIIYRYNFENAPNLGYFWFDKIISDSLYLRPSNPNREGYIFVGWFLDEESTIAWDENHPISTEQIITVFASWQAQ